LEGMMAKRKNVSTLNTAKLRLPPESEFEGTQTPFGTTQQFLYCYCRLE